MIDVAAIYPKSADFNHAYHVCGVLATISLFLWAKPSSCVLLGLWITFDFFFSYSVSLQCELSKQRSSARRCLHVWLSGSARRSSLALHWFRARILFHHCISLDSAGSLSHPWPAACSRWIRSFLPKSAHLCGVAHLQVRPSGRLFGRVGLTYVNLLFLSHFISVKSITFGPVFDLPYYSSISY